MTVRSSLQQLREIVKGTELEGAPGAEYAIPNSSETALMLEIDSRSIEHSWRIARRILSETNRWPIVTTSWNNDSGYRKNLAEYLFSRIDFCELDQNPRAIIERSKFVDVEEFLSKCAANEVECGVPEKLDWMLDQAFSITGRMPRNEELDADLVYKPHMVDRYILQYEVENGLFKADDQYRLSWFPVDNAFLVFLPITESWEALAYLYWWSAPSSGAEFYVALGNRWKSKYEADLVCHYQTMLQCIVSRPPQDPYDAWNLAREHALVSRYEIDQRGWDLHEYASGLVGCDRWFQYERP